MKRILIVDSDRFQAQNYGNNLKKIGYEVIYVEDGEACLSKVKEELPDLVLLEVLLPNLSGLSVLERLKEDKKTKGIPVLILTSLEDNEKRTEAARLGVTIYFVKSTTSHQVLITWIQGLIGPPEAVKV